MLKPTNMWLESSDLHLFNHLKPNTMKESLVDLKAKAYDVLAQIEYLQAVLADVNNKIRNFKEEEEAVVVEEEK